MFFFHSLLIQLPDRHVLNQFNILHTHTPAHTLILAHILSWHSQLIKLSHKLRQLWSCSAAKANSESFIKRRRVLHKAQCIAPIQDRPLTPCPQHTQPKPAARLMPPWPGHASRAGCSCYCCLCNVMQNSKIKAKTSTQSERSTTYVCVCVCV